MTLVTGLQTLHTHLIKPPPQKRGLYRSAKKSRAWTQLSPHSNGGSYGKRTGSGHLSAATRARQHELLIGQRRSTCAMGKGSRCSKRLSPRIQACLLFCDVVGQATAA